MTSQSHHIKDQSAALATFTLATLLLVMGYAVCDNQTQMAILIGFALVVFFMRAVHSWIQEHIAKPLVELYGSGVCDSTKASTDTAVIITEPQDETISDDVSKQTESTASKTSTVPIDTDNIEPQDGTISEDVPKEIATSTSKTSTVTTAIITESQDETILDDGPTVDTMEQKDGDDDSASVLSSAVLEKTTPCVVNKPSSSSSSSTTSHGAVKPFVSKVSKAERRATARKRAKEYGEWDKQKVDAFKARTQGN